MTLKEQLLEKLNEAKNKNQEEKSNKQKLNIRKEDIIKFLKELNFKYIGLSHTDWGHILHYESPDGKNGLNVVFEWGSFYRFEWFKNDGWFKFMSGQGNEEWKKEHRITNQTEED